MAGRNRGDPLFIRLARKIAGRPVRDGQAELRWKLAGQGDKLCELLGRKFRRATALGLVADDVEEKRLEVRVADVLRLSTREQPHVLSEPPAPTTYSLAVDAERCGHVDAEAPIG